jgi:predicted metal-dependent phosphotriesterase family hydrolase
VEEEGGDLNRTIICHVEQRLPVRTAPHSFDPAPFLELAKTGVYLEFDSFGWEESFRQRGKVDLPNDAIRLNHIMALAEEGYGSKVLMSHDLAVCRIYPPDNMILSIDLRLDSGFLIHQISKRTQMSMSFQNILSLTIQSARQGIHSLQIPCHTHQIPLTLSRI